MEGRSLLHVSHQRSDSRDTDHSLKLRNCLLKTLPAQPKIECWGLAGVRAVYGAEGILDWFRVSG
jgi:hypothetical protein